MTRQQVLLYRDLPELLNDSSSDLEIDIKEHLYGLFEDILSRNKISNSENKEDDDNDIKVILLDWKNKMTENFKRSCSEHRFIQRLYEQRCFVYSSRNKDKNRQKYVWSKS